jgi:hypothetical protein
MGDEEINLKIGVWVGRFWRMETDDEDTFYDRHG